MPAAAPHSGAWCAPTADPILSELDGELQREFDRWQQERKRKAGAGVHGVRAVGMHRRTSGTNAYQVKGRWTVGEGDVRVPMLIQEETSTRQMVAASEEHGWDVIASQVRSSAARAAAVSSSKDAHAFAARIEAARIPDDTVSLTGEPAQPLRPTSPTLSACSGSPTQQRVIKQTGQRPHTAPPAKGVPFVFNKHTPHQAFAPYQKKPTYSGCYPTPLQEQALAASGGSQGSATPTPTTATASLVPQGTIRPRSAPGGGTFVATPDSLAKKRKMREEAARGGAVGGDGGVTPDRRGDRDGGESTLSTWSMSSVASPSVHTVQQHGMSPDTHTVKPLQIQPSHAYDDDLLCDISEIAQTTTPSSVISTATFPQSTSSPTKNPDSGGWKPGSRVGSAGSQRSTVPSSRPQSASTHTRPGSAYARGQGGATPSQQDKPPLAPPRTRPQSAQPSAQRELVAAEDDRPTRPASAGVTKGPAATQRAPVKQEVAKPPAWDSPPLQSAPPPVEVAPAPIAPPEPAPAQPPQDTASPPTDAAQKPAANAGLSPLRHLPLSYTQKSMQDEAPAGKPAKREPTAEKMKAKPTPKPGTVMSPETAAAAQRWQEPVPFDPNAPAKPQRRGLQSADGKEAKKPSMAGSAGSRGSNASVGQPPESPSMHTHTRREIFELLEDQSALREQELFHIRRSREEILEGLPMELVPIPDEENGIEVVAVSPELTHRIESERGRIHGRLSQTPQTLETLLCRHRAELDRMEQLQLPPHEDVPVPPPAPVEKPPAAKPPKQTAAPLKPEKREKPAKSEGARGKKAAGKTHTAETQTALSKTGAGVMGKAGGAPLRKHPRSITPLDGKKGKVKQKKSASILRTQDWSLLPSTKRTGCFYPEDRKHPVKLQNATGIAYPRDETGHELASPPTRDGHHYEFFYFSRNPATAYESFCAKANKKQIMEIDSFMREETNARTRWRRKERDERAAIMSALRQRMLYYQYVFTEEQVMKMNVEKLVRAEDSARQLLAIEEEGARAPFSEYPEYEYTVLEKQARAYGDVFEPLAHEPVIDTTDVLYTTNWDEDQKIRRTVEGYDADIAAAQEEEVLERQSFATLEGQARRGIERLYANVAATWFDRRITSHLMSQYSERKYILHEEEVLRETLVLNLCNQAAFTAEVTGAAVPLQLVNAAAVC